eukprot:TRINITY_DN18662_c0_g1_i1.p2 TRINITY_DN18662_c0_g1~~TRINITY_DN18662_c0_g1_i1.p2  ORF type:complete len:124 (-),score=2.80 TRINITY_DN18662_c0_g1_i1:101-472(-)
MLCALKQGQLVLPKLILKNLLQDSKKFFFFFFFFFFRSLKLGKVYSLKVYICPSRQVYCTQIPKEVFQKQTDLESKFFVQSEKKQTFLNVFLQQIVQVEFSVAHAFFSKKIKIFRKFVIIVKL